MRCLYCGREIGAFNLRRDGEFCSRDHRKSYGDRLNKALHQIARPEPPPARVAGFAAIWPAREGCAQSSLHCWEPGKAPPVFLPRMALAAVIPADFMEADPPLCLQWMPGLQAEPVAVLLQGSTAQPALFSMSTKPPAFSMAAALAVPIPPVSGQWVPVPQAEAAESFIAVALGANAPRPAKPPAFSMAVNTATTVPPPSTQWMPPPAAEPVERMVLPSFDAAFASAPARVRLRTLELDAGCETLVAPDEPAADDQPFVEPPPCEYWMRAPEPEPVSRYVTVSVATEAVANIHTSAAALALAIGGPHMPTPAMLQPVPAAEPVTAGVWPRAAETPLNPLFGVRDLRLPDIAALSPFAQPSDTRPRPEVAAPVGCPEPAPVESWLRVAAGAVPTIAARAAYRQAVPSSPALVASSPKPALAGLVAGAPPEAVESLMVSTAVTERAPFTRVTEMQPRALAASAQQTSSGFEKPSLTPSPSAPKRPDNVLVLRPILTIAAIPPQQPGSETLPALPKAGFIPVEYHAQRMRGEPVCRLPWQAPRLQPEPPQFAVRPVFDRIEEETPAQKPARKRPSFAEVFKMPEARKWSVRPLRLPDKAIAAGLVIGAIWLGTGVARLNRDAAASRQHVFGSPATPSLSSSLSAGVRRTVPTPAQPEAGGPVAWLRRAIANRASYVAGDNFRDGMQAWGTSPKSYAPGWRPSPDGYVRPGELALFSPSLKLVDYRLEFLGQIDKNGMDWVVRAKDAENYYAMKVRVLETGLRPVIAMAHYPVVGGKPGHRVETPLGVMVHNNKPFQVAVNVKGSRFSASIEGEEVDTWSDETLPSGGVGFFAEAGESARIYWMKVTRNDDWLGRVCGMLAGPDNGPQATSELWGPSLGDPHPGSVPLPAGPDGAGNVTLAAAGLGLPGGKARRRRESRFERVQPWSS